MKFPSKEELGVGIPFGLVFGIVLITSQYLHESPVWLKVIILLVMMIITGPIIRWVLTLWLFGKNPKVLGERVPTEERIRRRLEEIETRLQDIETTLAHKYGEELNEKGGADPSKQPEIPSEKLT